MADIQAVRDRDPACFSFVMAALYFKGFQALQCYRVAHWMWRSNRRVRMRRRHRTFEPWSDRPQCISGSHVKKLRHSHRTASPNPNIVFTLAHALALPSSTTQA